ncbi:MAG: hypothetical protein A3C70_01220 [Candidatus Zambryskibacteria bacterium RIFCSPHIGHO2_02_FULL_43_14]|uniref:YdbS-like PH domain-containing protein n=1 Tax=Candidatus Zambryskibacteria bacterium RIFCSPHIGHO2_02_FULL_43_14 TaxID=1802748 RepID=A0A1G2TFG0_9BACT|nr:MAG: hypothetical protein A2829_00605 [Candidatus Zambryskibacteria bacterium RIFCSPHIGHO2_01_FULL_43_60]OHA96024.1 MAG: hypothetical protein A3C70_01220 [Candidatus Zambryskibacteria bacterium RIFCSPHIGHO2_02_FULL_43_14]OHB03089.1 MAG: hypothetical protein A3B03_01445 [Candidatus Zambryskibacteria bacterium RIFCSPLOWO2_01_FULL_42_41]
MIKSLLSIFQNSQNSFEGQLPGERVILLLRRHPFAILLHIGLSSSLAFIPIILGTVFISYIIAHGWLNLFLFASSIWYLGLWLIVFYSLTIYTLNTVIITDRRLIDNDQHGFFNREISELHSHRIQDVSVHTSGIIETFLQFGNITVQTAASEKQFVFHQISKPEKVKDIIMQITSFRHSGVKPVV